MHGGVLAIGSLYWCNHPSRVAWRSSHLSQAHECSVSVPIRYGRKSDSRGNTYTMVFSLLCLRRSHGLGVAKAIPLQTDVTTSAQLINEAESMWAAECKLSQKRPALSSTWGCVALLINPDSAFPHHVLRQWTTRVEREDNYGQISHTTSERSVVSKDGCLCIPWPETIEGAPLPLDFLLATATNPTLSGHPPTYARAKVVARAWKRDSAGNADYFWKTRASGICTYQDDALLLQLANPRSA